MIKIEDVSFCYANYDGDSEQNNGLHNINIMIPDGQVVLLCGESGCGKTTFTRLINGLIPHYYEGVLTGKVLIDDKEIHKLPIYETAELVGSVFQNPRTQFYNVDTTSEMAFGAENRGMPVEQIEHLIDETVKLLKIETLVDRSLFQLSGGEKQKIACACASVCDPGILVLDEPSSNLDMAATRELKRLLRIWKSQGKTIIICEHRLHYLSDIADRVLYIENGQVTNDIAMDDLTTLSNQQLQAKGLRPLFLNSLTAMAKPADDDINEIVLTGFCYTYKKSKHNALHLEDVSISKQSVIAVVGENGAGKSTFAQCLCGLAKGCKGQMLVDGHALNRKKRLSSFYMVMQDVNHQLFAETVLDEVLLGMAQPNEQDAMQILNSLDLLPMKNLHPLALSGGQKQRVAIASAIASGREYILFDEPTSGLDMRHMLEVSENIHKLRQQGKTIMIITHDLELIFSCCTHVLHLEKGKLRAYYPLDNDGTVELKKFFLQ